MFGKTRAALTYTRYLDLTTAFVPFIDTYAVLINLGSDQSSQIIVIIIVCQGGNDFFALLLSHNEAN